MSKRPNTDIRDNTDRNINYYATKSEHENVGLYEAIARGGDLFATGPVSCRYLRWCSTVECLCHFALGEGPHGDFLVPILCGYHKQSASSEQSLSFVRPAHASRMLRYEGAFSA